MTHEDVIIFAEKHNFAKPGDRELSPNLYRWRLGREIISLAPRDNHLREMALLAIEQLSDAGGGDVVKCVESRIHELREPPTSQEPEQSEAKSELELVEDEARELIRDLFVSKTFDRPTLVGLADVMSLKHTLANGLARDQRIRQAFKAVNTLAADLPESLKSIPNKDDAVLYRRILLDLQDSTEHLPTLMTRAKEQAMTTEDREMVYKNELQCVVSSIHAIYFGEVPDETSA